MSLNKNDIIDLPESWTASTLGKFVSKRSKGIVPNKTPEQIFELYSVPSHAEGKPEIVAGEEIGSNKQIVEDGTVLLCKINPRINRTWVVSKHSNHQNIASTEWITFPPNEAFDPKYLAYFMRQDVFRDFLAGNASGVGGSLMRVKPATVAGYPFPIAPPEQQKRIVAEIEKQFSRLDEAVANLKRVKANLKRYKAAVLKAAVEGKLTEEWRKKNVGARLPRPGRDDRAPTQPIETGAELLERILAERREKWQGRGKYKEPVAPDTSGLPELPEGWVWASVEQLSIVIGGLTKNQKRKSDTLLQLPYLRVANVYADELRLDDIEQIGVAERELDKLLVQKDDLLIVEGNGSPEQIGRVAIWNGSINPCVHQNHLIKVRLFSGCLPKFALNWLLSPGGRNRIREVSSSTSGLYTLSVGKVANLSIPLPPLAEQEEIVAEVERRLSLVAEAETQVAANLRRAERLRQSILKQAFSGTLISSGAEV